MNISGIMFLGAGYLLGNEKAREQFVGSLQKSAGQGIDMINKVGGEPDADETNQGTAEE